MLEMHSCSAMNCQIGSDQVWNSSKTTEVFWKKVVFLTSLEQMFKVWPSSSIHSWWCSRDWCVCSKMLCRCCLNDKRNEILFRINITLPLTTITGLDGVGQWLGLPGHQTSHQWTSGATLKPWFTCKQLILKKILLPVLLRQQQPPGSNLALFSTHVSLCYVTIGFVSRLVAVHLNICFELVRNTISFFLYFFLSFFLPVFLSFFLSFFLFNI